MGNGMNKVLPGLYIGNFRDSKDQEQLSEHNITHILAIHDNARKLPCNSNKEYLCIIASDSPGQNLTQFFPVCNDFIHNARLKGGSVLIHCLAGMSRSVTLAVTYVMCVTSLSWRDSLKAVQGARNVANPNVGFLKQLQEYEKEKLQDERRRLKDKFPDSTLRAEDEIMLQSLIASYYHYLSLGEMCDGNCRPGTACPRGLCHQNRSAGIFRRSYKESSTSPYRRSSSPGRVNASPSSSPNHSRNPSPTPPHTRNQSPSTLTPPGSPCRNNTNSNLNSNANEELNSSEILISKKSPYGSTLLDSTPPGSPARSYGYYTSSPSKSPIHSPSNSSKEPISSPSRSQVGVKGVYYPSTPPSSPARRRRNENSQDRIAPPGSPCKSLRSRNSENRSPVPTETNKPHINIDNRPSPQNHHRSYYSSSTQIRKSILQRVKLGQRETKSLDNTGPPIPPTASLDNTNKSVASAPQSPSKISHNKGSSNRFCQVITKLFPTIRGLSSSSKTCKSVLKSFSNTDGTETNKNAASGGAEQTEFPHSSKEDFYMNSNGEPCRYSNLGEASDNCVVIYELSKDIETLLKNIDTRDEAEAVIHETTPEIPEVSERVNTRGIQQSRPNIITNPLLQFENTFNKQTFKSEPEKDVQTYLGAFSAIMKDDILYVEAPSTYSEGQDDRGFGRSRNERKSSFPLKESKTASISSAVSDKHHDSEAISLIYDDPDKWDDISIFNDSMSALGHYNYPTECISDRKSTDMLNFKSDNAELYTRNQNENVDSLTISRDHSVKSDPRLTISEPSKITEQANETRPSPSIPPPLPPRQTMPQNSVQRNPPPIPPRKLKSLQSNMLQEPG